MSTVIVFGPTGNIGSVVAKTAHGLGGKVVLAMRNPTKAIPGLSVQEEKAGSYERVKADLTDAESVTAAVKATSATRAFIYLAMSGDGLRLTLEALKVAGIQFVVFLSSYTVVGDPREIPPSELIPFVHAQIEISLQETFGSDNFVAIRPGGFATNLLRFKDSINAGKVNLYGGEFQLDAITSRDMGEVSGTILVHGSKAGQQHVYLYGPQIISQKSAIETIGEAMSKSVVVSEATPQEGLDQFLQAGIPPPVADYMIRKLGDISSANNERTDLEQGVENVQLYLGRPATKFEDWVEANKGSFV